MKKTTFVKGLLIGSFIIGFQLSTLGSSLAGDIGGHGRLAQFGDIGGGSSLILDDQLINILKDQGNSTNAFKKWIKLLKITEEDTILEKTFNTVVLPKIKAKIKKEDHQRK